MNLWRRVLRKDNLRRNHWRLGCKKKATPDPNRERELTSPPPPPDDRTPTGRLIMWTVIALVLVFGVILYFRFDHRITPLVG